MQACAAEELKRWRTLNLPPGLKTNVFVGHGTLQQPYIARTRSTAPWDHAHICDHLIYYHNRQHT